MSFRYPGYLAAGKAPFSSGCDQMGLLTFSPHREGDTVGANEKKKKNTDVFHLWDVGGQGKQKSL